MLLKLMVMGDFLERWCVMSDYGTIEINGKVYKVNVEYPFIKLWGRHMGSYEYYIDGEVEKAREAGVSQLAIYSTDDEWSCLPIPNEHTQLLMVEYAESNKWIEERERDEVLKAVTLRKVEKGVYEWISPKGHEYRLVKREWEAPSPGSSWSVMLGGFEETDEDRLCDARDYLYEVWKEELEMGWVEGEVVTIYQKPLSREDIEGDAKLLKKLREDQVMECWLVNFCDEFCTDHVERWIRKVGE